MISATDIFMAVEESGGKRATEASCTSGNDGPGRYMEDWEA